MREAALFSRIDALMQGHTQVLVAIDGPCASGKTTLAACLARAYGATVVHMDDFFLRPEQRTPERYLTPGGNVDHERFCKEVLTPMRRNEPFLYRPYDCRTQTIARGDWIVPAPLCVIEGSYSLHPELASAYDLKVLLDIGAQEQSDRILRRSGPVQHARFLKEWIPLENLYFDRTNIASRCDMRLTLRAEGGDEEEA